MICRASSTYRTGLFDGLIVDNFAGGGGAGLGIEQAMGRPVDYAINHSAKALAMHRINHPGTTHLLHSDVWEVDPRDVAQGRPIDLAWFSPDCKHFSKAKGGRPVSPRVRGLAWVVIRWAELVRPRIIILENVEEFQTWGPLMDDGKPCPDRKGSTFHGWVDKLRDRGYQVEWRELRACDYGVPTIRKRLFLIARCDGMPIVWPEPTHGPGLLPYRTAAECIDWSIPCPSIFDRPRPLAENTLKRIAAGIKRYVIDDPSPFILPIAHYNGCNTAHDINQPLSTITSNPKGGAHALCVPTLVSTNHGETGGRRSYPVDAPSRTVQASCRGSEALVSAFLAKHYTGVVGHGVKQPIGTVTSWDHHSVVACHMINQKGTRQSSRGVNEPLSTVCAGTTHAGLVAALLVKYYGNDQHGQGIKEPLHTIPTKDRYGVITVNLNGEPYTITDIGLRMLQPRELFRCQGFPEDWVIDQGIDEHGNVIKLTKTDQVHMCGNSVCPTMARVLVEANVPTAAKRGKSRRSAVTA